jgi:hypothetical protein
MFSGRISDLEKIRRELEQRIETAKSASAQGRDPRDVILSGAHSFAPPKSPDRRGPIETEAMHSSVLIIVSAVQEAIAATEFATLNIEAAPLRSDLGDLIERLREIDEALRVLAAVAKTNVSALSRRRSPQAARRMDISTPAASKHHARSRSGSVADPSAAFAAILTAIVVWWRCVQLKASASAGRGSRNSKRSPSEGTRSTMSPARRPLKWRR